MFLKFFPAIALLLAALSGKAQTNVYREVVTDLDRDGRSDTVTSKYFVGTRQIAYRLSGQRQGWIFCQNPDPVTYFTQFRTTNTGHLMIVTGTPEKGSTVWKHTHTWIGAWEKASGRIRIVSFSCARPSQYPNGPKGTGTFDLTGNRYSGAWEIFRKAESAYRRYPALTERVAMPRLYLDAITDFDLEQLYALERNLLLKKGIDLSR